MEKYTGESSLSVTQAEAAERRQRLEDLSTEPPAGPTVMRQAHRNGLRRLTGLLKNRLKKSETVEDTIRVGLVLYLREWLNTYKQGVAEIGLGQVDRTILDIRRDTVMQILAEITRQDGSPAAMRSSVDVARDTGDRPPDGLPPADF